MGDGRLADLLARANVARAIVAATNDDAANLAIALAAKEANSEVRVVLRLWDADFARKVQGRLTLTAPLSASDIAAPSFVAAAPDHGGPQPDRQ